MRWPFQPVTPWGELVINGLSAHTFMSLSLDIRGLYKPGAFRGESTPIPRVPGQEPEDLIVDQYECSLRSYFTPAFDPAGNEYEDRFAGFELNTEIIRAAWLDPATNGSSLEATITTRSGNILTAGRGVQVLDYDTGSTDDMLGSPFLWNSVLKLRIPDGYFS